MRLEGITLDRVNKLLLLPGHIDVYISLLECFLKCRWGPAHNVADMTFLIKFEKGLKTVALSGTEKDALHFRVGWSIKLSMLVVNLPGSKGGLMHL